MSENTKYRRWGWGAVIGLIAMVLVGGLIIAMALGSGPKPSDNNTIANNNQTQTGENGGGSILGLEKEVDSSDENNAGDESNDDSADSTGVIGWETGNNSNAQVTPSGSATVGATQPGSTEIPQTGPESIMFTVGLMAIASYLFVLNAQKVAARR